MSDDVYSMMIIFVVVRSAMRTNLRFVLLFGFVVFARRTYISLSAGCAWQRMCKGFKCVDR